MSPTLPFRLRFAILRAAVVAAGALLSALPSALAAQQAPGSNPAAADEVEVMSLLPGDALEVGIWREEDMSGEFIVDEDGVVTLPLLGRVRVTGVPIDELEGRLLERYEVELRNPSIDIRPLRRVYVLGEVNEPGLLSVDPTVTLAGAVAMAGGASPEGTLDKIRVMRDGRVLLEDPGPEMDLVSIDVRSGDQIFVDRRSWFERNSAFLVSASIGAAGIIVQLLR